MNCFPVNIGTLQMDYDLADSFSVFPVTLGFDYWVPLEDLAGFPATPGYIVNESHILSLKYKHHENIVDLSVKEYIKHVDQEKLCGYRVPIHFPKLNVRSNPYVMGIWLCKINTGDHYLSDEFIKTIK